jgi:hypothetical protein
MLTRKLKREMPPPLPAIPVPTEKYAFALQMGQITDSQSSVWTN